MPKINIKEYDNTTSGITDYENFAVVVPGFVAQDKATIYDEAADENGIVEFTSQSIFKTTAGQVPAGAIAIEAKAPKATAISSDEMTEYKYYNTYANVLYTKAEAPEGTHDVGYLVDYDRATEKYYKYTKVNVAEESYDSDTQYYIIEAGDEGHDAKSGAANNHYGNQMAYELLGLGYTVLYKKITNVSELNNIEFWDCLRDKATYDFRYLVTGLIANNTAANNCISDIASYVNKTIDDYNPLEDGRGDCIALVDVDAGAYSATSSQASNVDGIIAEVAELTKADKNSFIFAPYVIYNMEDAVYQNAKFPASFHYLACAAYSFDTLGYSEWYAVSGFERGISPYSIASTGCRLGDAAINILQPRKSTNTAKAVNLIAKIRNNYYLYGNRTAANLPSELSGEDLKASHFANIRQLCTTIKKRVYAACRKFQFDPNSDILWINFKNEIEPTLSAMRSNQGVKDYDFIKVIDTRKALMSAIIRVVPIEAVEDFDISLTLEDSLSGGGTIIVGDND